MDKCHKTDHRAIEFNHKVIDELQKQVADLQAENKRLKEALRDIADHVCPKIYSPTCPEIAKQAIQEKTND